MYKIARKLWQKIAQEILKLLQQHQPVHMHTILLSLIINYKHFGNEQYVIKHASYLGICCFRYLSLNIPFKHRYGSYSA